MIRRTAWRAGLAALFLVGGIAYSHAQALASPVPEGEPRSGGELDDAEFGVRTDQFGLDRRVEMYQWRRIGEDTYDRVWKAAWIDSSRFSAGHENPPRLPLDSHRWWAPRPSLDGRPLDPAVLKALGRWQEFRPGFSRLPGNLAATFQPEGDGLTSSENPLDPKIGDLRISWRELLLPPLAGEVELRGGVWRLASGNNATAAAKPAAPGADPAAVMVAAGEEGGTPWWPWLIGALAIVAAVVAWRRPRR
ncbi:TMEM43 family protein [Lysobacter sp. F6437]|uniref:TMEM43 family protein n=1 Tax=Lysobacter sp. F6437 TaxID=3459296 RepID=UPI00403E0DD8